MEAHNRKQITEHGKRIIAMRTVGTFQDVYEAAKSYVNDEDEYRSRPLNPVVRREGDKWMLESDIFSAEDADFEVTLEYFDSWFWEDYKSDYTPTDEDMEDFVKTNQPEDE